MAIGVNPPGTGGMNPNERRQFVDEGYDTSYDREKRRRDLAVQVAEAEARQRAGRDRKVSKNQQLLQSSYDSATSDIDRAYGSLEALLRGQVNPYEGYQVQAAPQVAGLSELLGSQGVSNLPVQQLGAALQTQNQGQATAFQNLVNTLGQIYSTSQQGALADVGRMRTESRKTAATNKQDILKMLIEALRRGAL